MAKKKNFRSKPKFTIPLGIVAGFVPGAQRIYGHSAGGFEEMTAEASRIYLGYASTNKFGYNDTLGFHPYLLKYGTVPIVIGMLLHKLASRFGINSALSRAGVPIIRI